MSFAEDLRYAVRSLRTSPGFMLLAVLILALGIGANTAIFSLVSAVLLRPLPFADPERLVVLWEDATAVGGPDRVEVSPGTFVGWRRDARSFESIAALEPDLYNLTGVGEPEQLAGIRASGELFEVLRMPPIVGRTFGPADEGPDAVPVVVIGESLWRRRFGGDPTLVGRSIVLNGLSRTVIGVVADRLKFPNPSASVWLPASFTAEELARDTSYMWYVIARLAPATSFEQAQAELDALAAARPAPASQGVQGFALGATVASFHEQLTRDARPMLAILLGAVAAVLLICCANVANLLLARGAERRQELALRQALGAGQARVVRQLLTESALLAALGVGIGVAVATLSFGYLATLVPGVLPAALGLDWTVLAFSVVAAAVTVLVFGTGPALAAARVDLNDALKTGYSRGTTARRGHLRNGLVVTEITLTVVLLAAAGLLLRSYGAVLGVDPGFEPRNLLVAETMLSPTQYSQPATRAAFYERVLENVRALPGVDSAGYVNRAPLVEKGYRSLVLIDGRPPPSREDITRYIVSDRIVSPEYLATLGVPLVDGRHFDGRDDVDSTPAAIINETMARRHWPGEEPVGARFRTGGPEGRLFTVIGVVRDVRQQGLEVAPDAEMYFVQRQASDRGEAAWPKHLVVRTAVEPMALAASVREAVWAVDPNQPVSNLRSMSDVLDAEVANRNTQMTLVGSFALFALFLAAAGLYGVLSYTVAQRRTEIGVRMALGAARAGVVGAILKRAFLLAALGVALGLAGALGATRLLSSFLFGIRPADPATFAAVSALILAVAVLAAFVPARRAAGVDPSTALRAE